MKSKRWAALVSEIKLQPLFPIGSLTPSSPCPHKGRIRRGSVFYCVVCHESGMDHLNLSAAPVGSYIDQDCPSSYIEPTPASIEVDDDHQSDEPETRKARRARKPRPKRDASNPPDPKPGNLA